MDLISAILFTSLYPKIAVVAKDGSSNMMPIVSIEIEEWICNDSSELGQTKGCLPV